MRSNKGSEGDRQKVAVVTGSSSGIGYATSLLLARNGFYTYASVRNISKASNLESIANAEKLPLKLIQLDVTGDSSVKEALEKIVSEKGRIDVLVNNAGYGLFGAFEDISLNEIKAQYDTNLFGLIRTTQAVLPTMRKQKSGIIVNISSGVVPMGGYPGGSAYVGTKFAVEGLSGSLAYELEPFGIKVIIIEPGVIGTNFVNNVVFAKKSQDPNSPYSQITQKMFSTFEEMLKNASSPELVAKVVFEAVTNENPNLKYSAGKDVETLSATKRNMSDEEFHEMMKQNLKLDSIVQMQ
jgi:NAD(P)-dependent dehydrogenase (short-subunit alcohol dehydrogenase family)